jgi:hypothetical protein
MTSLSKSGDLFSLDSSIAETAIFGASPIQQLPHAMPDLPLELIAMARIAQIHFSWGCFANEWYLYRNIPWNQLSMRRLGPSPTEAEWLAAIQAIIGEHNAIREG